MDIFVKTGELLGSVELINRPTYVMHNAYGNVKFYPVLEPATIIDYSDLANDKIQEAYKKYDSSEEIAKDFYSWNPEETGGHLNDQKLIHFLGHDYYYHPNHKTRYGNVDKLYFLLPIIARWYYIKSGGKKIDDILSAGYMLPRGYRDGNSTGIHYTFDGDSSAIGLGDEEHSRESKFIPMVPNRKADRVVLYLTTPADMFAALDELLGLPQTVGIALHGTNGTDFVEEIEGTNQLCFAVSGTIPTITNCKIEVIASKGGVSLCSVDTEYTKDELNEHIKKGDYLL